ncbi:MAG: S9 family peptidase, partial [Proteobacteria bacterium]|nr:S9 family peptidase [Pseudomonadota bacterium]
IFYQKGLEGEPEVFIDPNALAADGTISINLVGFSKDNKYAAYSKSVGGSDWSTMHVMEIESKKEMPDVLEWVKFSGASWHNNGFYYSRYPAPDEGTELSGNNQYHSVYYHELGTDQSEDKLVFEDKENPDHYHFGGVTEDEKYFILYRQPGTDGYAVMFKDLENGGDFQSLFEGYSNKSSVVHHVNGKFLVRTDIDAPNYKLVAVDPANPAKE